MDHYYLVVTIGVGMGVCVRGRAMSCPARVANSGVVPAHVAMVGIFERELKRSYLTALFAYEQIVSKQGDTG
jgi:hypothetical protein